MASCVVAPLPGDLWSGGVQGHPYGAMLAEQFLDSLPGADNPVERLFLRQQLVEFSCRWAAEVHKEFHKDDDSACPFNPTDLVFEAWHDRTADPSEQFARWSLRFVDEFERFHLPPLASRARKFIDRHFADRVNIKSLATELRCTQARVDAEFRRAFGISPSQYQRRLRAWEGLRLLRGTNVKVEAVAHAVGYRSKKNFYQAIHDETGRTPAEIRNRRGGQ